jgi:hypothetical protein
MFNLQFRSELDALQDRTDKQAGKHIEIPLTVSILAEILRRVELSMNNRKQGLEE